MHPVAVDFVAKLAAIEPKPESPKRPNIEGPNYLIFFTARSGSSWLTELIAKNGGLGNPEEWFNPLISDGSAAHFGVNNVHDYIDAACRHGRDPVTSVFGAEITYAQLGVFNQIVNLFDFFPPKRTIFFCLRREDLVAQAMSLYRMVSGGQAHSYETGNSTDVPYDANQIEHWMEHLRVQEIGMARLFDDFGVSPHFLSYERMMTVPPREVLNFFRGRILRQEATREVHAPTQHAKLTSRRTADWKDRFLKDKAAYIKGALASRPPVRSDI